MVRSMLFGMALLGSGVAQHGWAADQNWPQWRGPGAGGVAEEGDYPVEFSSEQNVAWKATLPGRGSSTPAVWGDAIFVTCGIDGQDGVVCYGMDGQERWRTLLGAEREGKHRHGSGSNPSPATDGERVVAYFKSGTVACLDFDGGEMWRINLQQDYGKDTLWWDIGTSPVLAGDRVIVAVMQAGNSYLVALELASGDVLWHQPRLYKNAVESDQAYTTPEIVAIDGRQTVVTWGADHLTGHDLDTGELVWECGGFNPDNKGMWRPIASAVISGGVAVVPFGRGEFLAGVRLGGQGDITATNRLWEKRGSWAEVPTPIAQGDRVILLGDTGRLACVSAASGDVLWTAELPKSRHRFYASPVLAGDTLYCAREDGTLFVGRVQAGGFKLLAENNMGEGLVVGPVPIRGGLLIRGPEHLFWIERANAPE